MPNPHDPNNPRVCTGCRHLRYRPEHGLGNDGPTDTTVIPAFASPGKFVCDKFGILCGADVLPRPRTETCKETY